LANDCPFLHFSPITKILNRFLELTDLGYRRRSSSSSDEEIFTTGNRMRTIYQSETVLNSISVESSSRSRSSSSSSSGGPGS
ncbi:hypothetical protein OZD61_02250, partial [Wolbachia endosymbiont of Drosophila bocki]|uniref:hypothetical protein n=1 Tax=unclassified Wolbachia TaxID=2640676 RepID=UPI0023A94C8F